MSTVRNRRGNYPTTSAKADTTRDSSTVAATAENLRQNPNLQPYAKKALEWLQKIPVSEILTIKPLIKMIYKTEEMSDSEFDIWYDDTTKKWKKKFYYIFWDYSLIFAFLLGFLLLYLFRKPIFDFISSSIKSGTDVMIELKKNADIAKATEIFQEIKQKNQYLSNNCPLGISKVSNACTDPDLVTHYKKALIDLNLQFNKFPEGVKKAAQDGLNVPLPKFVDTGIVGWFIDLLPIFYFLGGYIAFWPLFPVVLKLIGVSESNIYILKMISYIVMLLTSFNLIWYIYKCLMIILGGFALVFAIQLANNPLPAIGSLFAVIFFISDKLLYKIDTKSLLDQQAKRRRDQQIVQGSKIFSFYTHGDPKKSKAIIKLIPMLWDANIRNIQNLALLSQQAKMNQIISQNKLNSQNIITLNDLLKKFRMNEMFKENGIYRWLFKNKFQLDDKTFIVLENLEKIQIDSFEKLDDLFVKVLKSLLLSMPKGSQDLLKIFYEKQIEHFQDWDKYFRNDIRNKSTVYHLIDNGCETMKKLRDYVFDGSWSKIDKDNIDQALWKYCLNDVEQNLQKYKHESQFGTINQKLFKKLKCLGITTMDELNSQLDILDSKLTSQQKRQLLGFKQTIVPVQIKSLESYRWVHNSGLFDDKELTKISKILEPFDIISILNFIQFLNREKERHLITSESIFAKLFCLEKYYKFFTGESGIYDKFTYNVADLIAEKSLPEQDTCEIITKFLNLDIRHDQKSDIESAIKTPRFTTKEKKSVVKWLKDLQILEFDIR